MANRGQQHASVARRAWAFACLLAALSAARVGYAEDVQVSPLSLRTTLGGAAMVSETQTGRMGYSFGPIGDAQIGYAPLRWLDLRASAILGAFPRKKQVVGGLLAPTLGVVGGIPFDGIRPYVQLDVGPGFTGSDVRPFFRGSLGVEFRASEMLTIGPVVGYSQLFQKDGPGYSSDARFFWFGASITLRPLKVATAPPPPPKLVWKTRHRTITTVLPPSPPNEEPLPPVAPSPELEVLLDEALPTQRVELLAPVLFALDSDELQPIGVAMLHEVARELARRPDIKLLEVQGYADARGEPEHNMQLSERRGQRVIDWLVAHGVERERLQLAPRGATQFVQPGTDESDHEQNRRVVFRVLNPGDR